MKDDRFTHFLKYIDVFETDEIERKLKPSLRKSIFGLACFLNSKEAARELWKDLPEGYRVKEDEMFPDADEEARFTWFFEYFWNGLFWQSPNGKFFLQPEGVNLFWTVNLKITSICHQVIHRYALRC